MDLKTGPDGRRYLKDRYPKFRNGFVDSVCYIDHGDCWETRISCVFDGITEEYSTAINDEAVARMFYAAVKDGVSIGSRGLISTRETPQKRETLLRISGFDVKKTLIDCINDHARSARKKWEQGK